ncbi:hypothetical protein ACIQC9_07905 [Brevundimonas sp. NPDC092305]|uniref:hypothetical protein n=1 Tax=Brevundimonas sp. NPDC092305 TaxID=3363957 RepID=UPI0038160020
MRTRMMMAAMLALAACAPATAQTPPEGIVWVALRDINEYAFDEDDTTNRPPLAMEAPAGMLRAVDVSPDGKPDWLIDYQNSGLNGFCGTGGCLQRLYVSDGDRYVRALDNQALELTVEGGEVRVWVHHLYCANDNPDCRYRFSWDQPALALVQRSTTSARPMGDEAWKPIRPPED